MANILQLLPGRMIVADKFDSENMHIRKDAGTDRMPVVMERTVFPGNNSGSNDYARPIYSIFSSTDNKQYTMINIWPGVLSAVSDKPDTITVGV